MRRKVSVRRKRGVIVVADSPEPDDPRFDCGARIGKNYTVPEVAEMLRISEKSVCSLIRSRDLTAAMIKRHYVVTGASISIYFRNLLGLTTKNTTENLQTPES